MVEERDNAIDVARPYSSTMKRRELGLPLFGERILPSRQQLARDSDAVAKNTHEMRCRMHSVASSCAAAASDGGIPNAVRDFSPRDILRNGITVARELPVAGQDPLSEDGKAELFPPHVAARAAPRQHRMRSRAFSATVRNKKTRGHSTRRSTLP